MKKILKVLLLIMLFAGKLQAQCFTNLKCTLSWSSNAFGDQHVDVNTTFGSVNNGTYSLPFDATNITIGIFATNFSNFGNVIFSLKNGYQIVLMPNGSPYSNPYTPQPSTSNQPSFPIVVWSLPISIFQSNLGISIESSCSGFNQPFPTLTGINFSGSINNTVPPLVLSGTVFSPATCTSNNGQGGVSISGAGGTGTYNCIWNTTPPQTCQNPINLAAGTYTCTVTSAGLSKTVTIVMPSTACPPIVLTSSVVSPAICTAKGSAKVTPTGGTGAYTYSWNTSPVQTTATATNLVGGAAYICRVTSGTAFKDINVTVPITNTTLTTTIKLKPQTTSGTKRDFISTIEVFVNNVKVTAPSYTFLWSTGATTATIDLPMRLVKQNLNTQQINCIGCPPPATPVTPPQVYTPVATTTYTVTVTDANGCTGTASYVY
jgi:hypothetical protein